MDSTELRNSLIALHSASFAWAMLCCRDRELAEEVLQSVYVKVLSGRAPFRGEASLRTWLFTVIRNASRDQRRRSWWARVLRGSRQALETVAAPDGDGDRQDHVGIVRAALERLPERQRQVAHLVFYQDLTVADAAQVMGVTVGTARQHYARAKDTLTRLLSTRTTTSQNETDPSILR